MTPLRRRAFLAAGLAAGAARAATRPSLPIWGATHVDGAYAFGSGPFLLEGAERLLALGARAIKVWFSPHRIAESYRWNHTWPSCRTFDDLLDTPVFQKLLAMPFQTFALLAQMPVDDGGWRPQPGEKELPAITESFRGLARRLYTLLHDREVTIILQNWEGDWLLRGHAGERWDTPPSDASLLCRRMAAWMAARQAGVDQARALFPRARCRVLNAIEVNRIWDRKKGIPTVTHDVLPEVEVDLVSYSAYESLETPALLREALVEIRRHARTARGPLGAGALMLGEIGLPENDQPRDIALRWQGLVPVATELGLHAAFVWLLYCNEPRPGLDRATPVTDPLKLRGFYLVKPDGSLSETGRFFSDRWTRT